MSNVVPLPIKIQYDDASKAFIKWLETSKQGEKYCYFSGPHIGRVQVARLAMKAYEKGTVTLFQSRNALEFNYWAQKIR